MKKKIALVCCRGNSKGIPKKNIKKTKIFDDIFLSTDSNEIAKIGKKYGFTVPGLRPKNLATNNSDVFDTHKYFFKTT